MNRFGPKKQLSQRNSNRSPFPGLILRERDHTILRLVYEHRFLSRELLWQLLKTDNQTQPVTYVTGIDGKKRPIRYRFGQQALSKRLKQLFDANFLKRHYIADQPIGKGYGAPKAIYGLGTQSPKILQRVFYIPDRISKYIVESNNVKSPFLRHTLDLVTFKITLELACQKYNEKAKLLFWEQGEHIQDYVNAMNDKKERFCIHADAFFGLELSGKRKRHFFLEIDRGTEPIVSTERRANIRRKLVGYKLYYKSKKVSNRYAYRKIFNNQIVGINIQNKDNLIIEDETINGFQVLFVTPGKINDDKTVSGRLANIISELSYQNKSHAHTSLFWFTTPDTIDIENPESIFGNIWITSVHQKGLLSLIE